MSFLFLHGYAGDPSSWNDLVARLPDAAAVQRVTLLGHGAVDEDRASDALADGFLGEVDRIGSSLRERGLRGLHLVGYSLGARVALGLLLRHADLFARATLIGAHPGLRTDDERHDRASADEAWAHLLDTQGIEAFVAAWELQPIFATQRRLSSSLRAAERARRLAHRPEGLALAMRALGLARMPDFRPLLPRVRLPIRLIAGAEDPKFAALAEEMARALVHCSIRLVSDAGHNVALEQPEAVLAALLEEP